MDVPAVELVQYQYIMHQKQNLFCACLEFISDIPESRPKIPAFVQRDHVHYKKVCDFVVTFAVVSFRRRYSETIH